MRAISISQCNLNFPERYLLRPTPSKLYVSSVAMFGAYIDLECNLNIVYWLLITVGPMVVGLAYCIQLARGPFEMFWMWCLWSYTTVMCFRWFSDRPQGQVLELDLGLDLGLDLELDLGLGLLFQLENMKSTTSRDACSESEKRWITLASNSVNY